MSPAEAWSNRGSLKPLRKIEDYAQMKVASRETKPGNESFYFRDDAQAIISSTWRARI